MRRARLDGHSEERRDPRAAAEIPDSRSRRSPRQTLTIRTASASRRYTIRNGGWSNSHRNGWSNSGTTRVGMVRQGFDPVDDPGNQARPGLRRPSRTLVSSEP